MSGFVGALAGHSRPLAQVPEIITVRAKIVHSIIDSNPQYKGIERMMSIEPADRLIIDVL